MRKITGMLRLLLTLALAALTLPIPALAAYKFESGADTPSGFGHATGCDEPVAPDTMSANERRNKDNSALPPPYFYGSGDIPTNTSSPYHGNFKESGFAPPSQEYPAIGYEDYAPGINDASINWLSSTSQTVSLNTAPLYYSDASIGSLYVHSTGKIITVWEGENLDNLAKGAGHFAGTSAWDGNVAIAGHNRGSSGYFSFVKDMQTGDRVTYTTRYGTRTYEVFGLEQIGERDTSVLAWSRENLLTLITCVENTPELRYAARLREAGA
jgi:sortase A